MRKIWFRVEENEDCFAYFDFQDFFMDKKYVLSNNILSVCHHAPSLLDEIRVDVYAVPLLEAKEMIFWLLAFFEICYSKVNILEKTSCDAQ
jgi:hypothetical protein